MIRERRRDQSGLTGARWGLHNDVAVGRQAVDGLRDGQAFAYACEIKNARHSRRTF